MSNIDRKNENDNIRKVQNVLNELNRVVNAKKDAIAKVPEVDQVSKFEPKNNIDVITDEAFSELSEQVAAMQFSGKKKDEICSSLNIDKKAYKDIVLSEHFSDVKKRLAEDQKTYILAQILEQLDGAFRALSELTANADEDKTRLNAAALILEHASRLLEDQKSQFPSIGNVIKDAAKSGESVTMNLAQVILSQRRDRGLER